MNPVLRKTLALTSLFLVSSFLGACSGFSGGFGNLGGGKSGSSTVRDSQGLTFQTQYPIQAYQFTDINTADVYLTDLTDDELAAFFTESRDWSQITGTIVQVHLFLKPKPGRTPIEPTAASVAIRWVVITQGEIGVYDGAGFMLPGGNITKDSISGTVRNAPLRLTRRTPRFSDPLITPEMNIRFATKLDVQSAAELASRAEALAARATSTR